MAIIAAAFSMVVSYALSLMSALITPRQRKGPGRNDLALMLLLP